MAPRTVYANLSDGLQNLSLWDASLADMGKLGVIPCTAAGTNTIILTPITTVFAPTVSSPPQQLQQFSFVATATSTGSVTINGLKLYKEDGATQAAANDILINVLYGVVYNSALNGAVGGYQIAFPITSIISPVISGATITTSTYNGNTWTTGTGTLTIAAGKTETFNNTLTFAGTDGTTLTFPTTSATIARTDTGQTFTGTNAFGVLTATTINGNTFTAGTYTLTGTAGKTLNFTNSLTLSGTDATTMTFPTTSATLARTDAGNTFTGTQNLASLTVSSAVATDGSKNLVSVTNTGSGNNVLATTPTISQPNIVGTTTNDSAAAGSVGEFMSATVVAGSAVSLTTGTPANITSISLTAGDWDVSGNIGYTPAGSTTATNFTGWISSTSAAIPTAPNSGGEFTLDHSGVINANPIQCVGPMRFSLAGTTTVFLSTQATFAVSTMGAYGFIRARRVR